MDGSHPLRSIQMTILGMGWRSRPGGMTLFYEYGVMGGGTEQVRLSRLCQLQYLPKLIILFVCLEEAIFK